CGYIRETAEGAIAAGDADIISFGRPFISNPDLVERFRNDWPLADAAPLSDWAAPTVTGYTDLSVYASKEPPAAFDAATRTCGISQMPSRRKWAMASLPTRPRASNRWSK